MSTSDNQNEVTRRAFLARAIGACLAFVAALLGIPVVGAIVAPALRTAGAPWIALGPASGFADGVPTSTQFTITVRDGWINSSETKGVWVIRLGNDFTVFNGRCTHLGCAYHWNAAQNQFVCPCHAGVYAIDGRVLSGPPPRSLDQLPARVDNGTLYVQYYDFRLGIPERVVS